MARTKQLNLVVRFSGTPYVINDLGPSKSPRFELYNESTKNVEAKSDNPRNFDNFVWKEDKNARFSEKLKTKTNRRRKEN